MKVAVRIFIALLLGLAAGALLSGSNAAPTVLKLAEPIGNLWLTALKMTILPLVAGLLFTGIATSMGTASGSRLAGTAIACFLGLYVFSTLWAMVLVPPLLQLWPAPAAAAQAMTGVIPGTPVPAIVIDPGQWLLSLVPANIFKALAEGDTLPVVVFITLFALASGKLPRERHDLLVAFFEAVKDAMLVIIDWVFVVGPIGVFALAMTVGLKAGVGAFGILAHYIAVLIIIQSLLIVAIYIAVALLAGDVMGFARAVLPAQAVAASTQSSIASLPAMYEGAESLKLPDSVSGVVLPLAVALFRITGPCTNVAVVLYVGHLNGVAPGVLALAAGILVAVAASVSSGGVSGAVSFLASTVPIANALGVPPAALPLLLAVELIPDIFRTVGNVTGDLAVTTVLARRQARAALTLH
jgi:Na+/H+-dicarboxylate symporter